MKARKISAAGAEARSLPALFDKEKIEFQPIQCVNWAEYPYRPEVKFRVAHAQDAVLLHFKVKEASLRAKYGEDNGAVFFKHRIGSLGGKTVRANFYKCGDELQTPHFLSWNPVRTERPDFHRPDFFGVLEFEQKPDQINV